MRRGLVRIHHGGGNDLREVTAEVFQMRFSGVLDQVEGRKGGQISEVNLVPPFKHNKNRLELLIILLSQHFKTSKGCVCIMYTIYTTLCECVYIDIQMVEIQIQI